MKLHPIQEIIDDIKLGKLVLLMDDEDRENEGDLIIAAEKVRAEDINFMATHARGLICLTLTQSRCEQLNLSPMVRNNTAPLETNFTVSIEAASGITTGISAKDRAHTILTAVKEDASPDDIVQPGHVFPVAAQIGGVLTRAGHTEAGCDLAALAGLEPASVIVEVMNDDGSMARRDDLEKFAKLHDIKIGTIADLIRYRVANEKTLFQINKRFVNTQFGEFLLYSYRDTTQKAIHFALVKGNIPKKEATLVRVHTSSIPRDVLSIKSPDDNSSHWDFYSSMKYISEADHGVLVLLCQDGSTEGIDQSIEEIISSSNRIVRQDLAYRQIGAGSQILKDLGVSKMRVLGSPLKFAAISGFDLEVVEYLCGREYINS
jgi:3,4-dihydroxy 2-butanone 4-phosphate synthase/GTP cyclohydrolase II